MSGIFVQQRQGCLRALSSALRGLRPNGTAGWLGHSHGASGWCKSKSLAIARSLFAGPQRVTHGMLRALISRAVAPHLIRVLAFQA